MLEWLLVINPPNPTHTPLTLAVVGLFGLSTVSAPLVMPLRDWDIPMNVPFTLRNKQPFPLAYQLELVYEAAGCCRDLIAVSSLRRAPIITGISLNGEKEDEEEEARSSRFRWIIRIQRY